MTRLRRLAAATLAATALVTVLPAAAALAGPPIGTPEGPKVDPIVMAQRIESTLGNGNVVGFSYAIAKNGKFAAGNALGSARRAPDQNPRAFAQTDRIDIASATKNFMAAATLKLLVANRLNPQTFVRPYLPASWTKGTNWDKVRFVHLLAHTSGLGQMGAALTPQQQAASWNTVYSGVQWAAGRTITVPSGYSYTNMNYAMLRVILPRLWQLAEPSRGVPNVTSTNSGTWALAYINEKLLVPAGIGTRSCQPANTSTAPLAYDVNQAQSPGSLIQLTGANAEVCAGHRGLQLSALDMVRFQAHLRHGTIVAPQVRFWMDSQKLGWNPNSNTGNSAGVYFHGGDLFVTSTTSGNTNPGSLPPGAPNQQSHTCIAKFPDGVEAALIVNSQARNSATPCNTLRGAYLAAAS